MSNFHPLEVVGSGSETQLQVGAIRVTQGRYHQKFRSIRVKMEHPHSEKVTRSFTLVLSHDIAAI